jgi:HAD superfamily hydrolase (TIGR01662 family)
VENKIVIFDFDGTIADTFSVVVDIVNSLSEEYGFEKLGIEEVSAMRHLRAQDLLKVFRMPLWRLPSFMLRVKELLSVQIVSVPPIAGMVEALTELKHRGYRLGILSSNQQETIQAFLAHNHLELFEFIYCEKDLFGKARVLRNFVKQYSLSVEDVVYVGDETRDVEAAHKAHMKVVAVAWGYNSALALERQGPGALIDKTSELVSTLDTLLSK